MFTSLTVRNQLADMLYSTRFIPMLGNCKQLTKNTNFTFALRSYNHLLNNIID